MNDVYVEHVVNNKYSSLKTSDNLYKYKNYIKELLRYLQEIEVLGEVIDLDGEIRFIINPVVNLLMDDRNIEEIIKQHQDNEGEEDGQISTISCNWLCLIYSS